VNGEQNVLTLSLRTTGGNGVVTNSEVYGEFIDADGARSDATLIFPENTLDSQNTEYVATLDFGSDPAVDLGNLVSVLISLSDDGRTKIWGGNTLLSLNGGAVEYKDNQREGRKLVIKPGSKSTLALGLIVTGRRIDAPSASPTASTPSPSASPVASTPAPSASPTQSTPAPTGAPIPNPDVPTVSPTAVNGEQNVLTVSLTTAQGNGVVTSDAVYVDFVDSDGISSGLMLLFPENTLDSTGSVYVISLDFGSDPVVDLENLETMRITLGGDGKTKLLGGHTFLSLNGEDAAYQDDRKRNKKLVIKPGSKATLSLGLNSL